jgi:hypothetical protein
MRCILGANYHFPIRQTTRHIYNSHVIERLLIFITFPFLRKNRRLTTIVLRAFPLTCLNWTPTKKHFRFSFLIVHDASGTDHPSRTYGWLNMTARKCIYSQRWHNFFLFHHRFHSWSLAQFFICARHQQNINTSKYVSGQWTDKSLSCHF